MRAINKACDSYDLSMVVVSIAAVTNARSRNHICASHGKIMSRASPLLIPEFKSISIRHSAPLHSIASQLPSGAVIFLHHLVSGRARYSATEKGCLWYCNNLINMSPRQLAWLFCLRGDVLRSVSCVSSVEHASSYRFIQAFFIINTRYSVHKAPELRHVPRQAMTLGDFLYLGDFL